MEYHAHISEDSKVEPVSEHLKNTAVLASYFSEPFDAKDQAYYIGLMHDIGKYSEEFQNRLLGGQKVDHSTAGAYECAKKGQVPAAFCIAGHHSGIPDRGNRSDLDEGTLMGRLNRALWELLVILMPIAKQQLFPLPVLRPLPIVPRNR